MNAFIQNRLHHHESLLTAIVLNNDPCDRHYSPMDEYHLLQVARVLGASPASVKSQVERILVTGSRGQATMLLDSLFMDLRDKARLWPDGD